MSPHAPFPIRQACPPGACDCGREQLFENTDADARILKLTKEEEKRLIERIERINSLHELRYLLQRLTQQLGIQLRIEPGEHEVRTVRGLVITIEAQTGLCRKTRQTLPAAIRRALEANHPIVYELLDEDGLFG
ncbi:hypothetical protein L1889_03490 [Paenalcaligenes niemegkensis]|uniref:hypothetical protein n=1 Tax=Paenalcaligenes niemegkensis TaxID=2895469 RepID=UPI001EE7D463|nr:hypothetical protein [Paenalcaligenes niemegkensis]MCQ9615877.1 hypothetical protein [Paenalcaligenes niemegkensis]